MDLSISLNELQKEIVANGFKILTINVDHAIKVADLPSLHHDLFDRMLIAQSMVEPLILITSDKAILQYKEVNIYQN